MNRMIQQLLKNSDPGSLATLLKAIYSAPNAPGYSARQSQIRDLNLQNISGPTKGPEERAKSAQAGILEQQLEQLTKAAESSKPRGGGLGRAGNAFGSLTPSTPSFLGDMLNPNTSRRIREEREEDRMFQEKYRDATLESLLQQTELSEEDQRLKEEMFALEKYLKEAANKRDAVRHSTKRKSLLEMFG